MALRRISEVAVGAMTLMWVPGIFVRLVDVPYWLAVVLLVLAGLVGGYGGYREGRRLEPFGAREHRDAVLGWTFIVIVVGIIASLILPMPWAAVAAASWALAAFFIARALLEATPPERAKAAPG